MMNRDYFELRIYHIDSQQQRDGFEYLVLKPAPCSQI
jgi:hypothetical protein